MTGTLQYVTLGAAGEVFAAPVERVQQILEVQPVTRLPRAPADLLGMIDVRGQGVPVVDLRTTLGLETAPDDENTRIVVLSVRCEGRDARMALKTDRVFEVTVLDGAELDPPPQLARHGWAGDCIAGIGRRNGGFVTVLDLDRLLGGIDLGAAAGEMPPPQP